MPPGLVTREKSSCHKNKPVRLLVAAALLLVRSYPQDVSLLNEARENAETLLDVLHDPADGKKPRIYRKRARKDYLKYTRCRKHTEKMTRKSVL